jgi:hypothetical protein
VYTSELGLDHTWVLRLFGPLFDSMSQSLDDILLNPRAQAHPDPFFTRWNSRRYHRSHNEALSQEVSRECMRSGREETNDRCWRFGFEVGQELRERFRRVNSGISEDVCWGTSNDGVEEVMELCYA